MTILGMDISKAKIDVALLHSEAPEKFFSKKISNNREGFENLLEWCQKKINLQPNDSHLTMEATGPYHERAAHYFHDQGCCVSVVNPALVKHFAKSEGLRAKNDQIDAKVIARFTLKMKPKRWEPPAPEYQELSDLLHRLESVIEALQREENRLGALESGASPSVSTLNSLERSIQFWSQEKERLESEIKKHIDTNPTLKGDQDLLTSIPGIGEVTAAWMNALFRHHSKFQTARQAAAFVGLTPTEHTSGSSIVKKPRLSKTGPSIYRKKLFMAAMSAINWNPDIKALYERMLANGKTKLVTLGAAMRKLVHICFGVIKHQTEYQPQNNEI